MLPVSQACEYSTQTGRCPRQSKYSKILTDWQFWMIPIIALILRDDVVICDFWLLKRQLICIGPCLIICWPEF